MTGVTALALYFLIVAMLGRTDALDPDLPAARSAASSRRSGRAPTSTAGGARGFVSLLFATSLGIARADRDRG